MNIYDYVTPVSKKPRIYLIALENDSKTLKNIKETSFGLIQLLSKKDISYVRRLGYKSGHGLDKLNRIKCETKEYKGLTYLKSSLAFLYCKFKVSEVSGDHTLVLGEVVISSNLRAGDILRLDDLKSIGILK